MDELNVKPSSGMTIANVEEKEDIIDLVKIFSSLLEHWFLIIFLTVVTGAIGYFGSKFLVAPMYASTSQLYVLSKSTSITSVADIQTGTSLTNDYVAVVTDRPILDRVIQNLNLDISYKELSKKISVDNPSNSRLLNIRVTDPNAEQAKAIADEMANVVSDFIAEKMDQDPPSIISYGYADGSPVSPNTTKTAAIGALIGFVLAALLAIFKSLSHDVVMTPADVENKLGLYMLAALPFEENLTGKKGKRRKKSN